MDHWAIRQFSSDTTLQERFFEAFADRGTVMFSIMNVVELSANTGRSADEIRVFLRRIGPHWFANTMDPIRVIERENSRPGDPSAPVSDEFLNDRQFSARLQAGDLTLASAVDLTRAQAGQQVLDAERSAEPRLIQHVLAWRERYDEDPPSLDRKWPVLPLDRLRPMRPIYNGLMRLCITDQFRFTENHVRDLFHAAVPLAYADIVLLDPHWANQARQKLRLGPPFVRVYTRGELDDFLGVLAASPRTRGVR
jgi:hypothetical protein